MYTDLTQQKQLFAFTPRDLVPSDSDVWLFIDLFDQLNLEEFYSKYSSQGQESFDPRLMLRTIFYGLAHGTFSGRKLQTACEFDNRYIVLSGARKPFYRTFHRFLNRHDKEISDFFSKVVQIASTMGLVKLGRWAIDGTRIRGYTSQERTIQVKRLQEVIGLIENDIAKMREQCRLENAAEADVQTKLPEEIVIKEKRLEKMKAAKAFVDSHAYEMKPTSLISFNDPEAIGMNRGGDFIQGYNGQAIVDETAQIVVAADIFRCSNDTTSLPTMLKIAEANCGAISKEILADAGYQSLDNLRNIEDLGSEAIIATKKPQKRESEQIHEHHYEDLKSGAIGGEYHCKAGLKLPIQSYDPNFFTFLEIGQKFCGNCQFQKTCKLYERSEGKEKYILRVIPETDRKRIVSLYERSRTEAFKESYRFRKAIVEPVFANLKYNKILRLHYTGKKNAQRWWKMACTAHNIEKIIAHRSAAPVY